MHARSRLVAAIRGQVSRYSQLSDGRMAFSFPNVATTALLFSKGCAYDDAIAAYSPSDCKIAFDLFLLLVTD